MQNFEEAYVTGRKEIIVNYQGKEVKFFANELGYLQSQSLAVKARREGLNVVALIVSESITSEDGLKFTYDEVLRLRKEYSQAFTDAVHSLNGDQPEKK